jgi:hypothetical protein
MIGKAEWFRMRKYGGWGITPATKEGWIYLGVMMIPLLVSDWLPGEEKIKMIVSFGWMAILIIDIVEIMSRMKKDEREKAHEAMAERNALWFMLTVIVAGLLYRAIKAGLKEEVYIDPVLTLALLGGAVVKGLTFFSLRKK